MKIGKDLGFSQSYISRMEKKIKENLHGCIRGKKTYDPICDCRKVNEIYKITFYTTKLRSTENIVRIVEDEARKVGLVYCKIKEVKGIYFTITILNEDNSMIFLANLTNIYIKIRHTTIIILIRIFFYLETLIQKY